MTGHRLFFVSVSIQPTDELKIADNVTPRDGGEADMHGAVNLFVDESHDSVAHQSVNAAHMQTLRTRLAIIAGVSSHANRNVLVARRSPDIVAVAVPACIDAIAITRERCTWIALNAVAHQPSTGTTIGPGAARVIDIGSSTNLPRHDRVRRPVEDVSHSRGTVVSERTPLC